MGDISKWCLNTSRTTASAQARLVFSPKTKPEQGYRVSMRKVNFPTEAGHLDMPSASQCHGGVMSLGPPVTSAAVCGTPWPCKICGQEPHFTVWHAGDERATDLFDTETRICDACWHQPDNLARKRAKKTVKAMSTVKVTKKATVVMKATNAKVAKKGKATVTKKGVATMKAMRAMKTRVKNAT